jgi:hypothetical protein
MSTFQESRTIISMPNKGGIRSANCPCLKKAELNLSISKEGTAKFVLFFKDDRYRIGHLKAGKLKRTYPLTKAKLKVCISKEGTVRTVSV